MIYMYKVTVFHETYKFFELIKLFMKIYYLTKQRFFNRCDELQNSRSNAMSFSINDDLKVPSVNRTEFCDSLMHNAFHLWYVILFKVDIEKIKKKHIITENKINSLSRQNTLFLLFVKH